MNKNLLFLLVGVLCIASCKIPYNKKDVYYDKAELSRDEAPHIKNSLEWWYFTGHLTDSIKNKTLGVEYVVFHFNPTNIKGGWLINVAVSDPDKKVLYYDHEFMTKKKNDFIALPLDFKFDKKIKSELKGKNGEYQVNADFSNYPISVNFKTKPLKPVVLHDGVGYEQYNNITKAGYYSFPRLETEGEITIADTVYNVAGDLWYDRQWNCIGVFDTKVAWDWFSIQFEESNSELMVYRVYNLKTKAEFFGGTYTDSSNVSTFLESNQIQLKELNYWKSLESGANYPIEWEIEVSDLNLKTKVKAKFPNQELGLNFSAITKFYYWEGMCDAEGIINGQKVKGNSYVEMTNRHRIKSEKNKVKE